MTNLNQRSSKNIPPFNEKKNEKTDDMVTNMDEVKLERYLKVTHYLKNNIIIHENRNEINNNNDDKDEEIKKVDVQDNLINIINDLNKKPLLNNKSYLVNGEMIKIDDTSKKKKGKKKCESTGISFVKPRYNDQNGIFENLYNNDVGQEANNNLIEKNPTFVFEQPKKIFNKQEDEVLKIHNELGHSQKPNPCETYIIMGNINHSIWFSSSNRKVLIMSFEHEYLEKLSQFLFKKNLTIPEKIGFTNNNKDFKDLKLRMWFLCSKNRHLWRHHYLGTQGIIIIFSCKDPNLFENLMIETLNIFNDDNVKNVPVLIIFDKYNQNMENIIEKFRTKINLLSALFYNIQILSFNDKEISSINYGLDWLAENMTQL